MIKTYIMAVTPDEYELPISPPFETQKALAEFLGVDKSNMNRAINHPREHRRYKRKYVKVDIAEGE